MERFKSPFRSLSHSVTSLALASVLSTGLLSVAPVAQAKDSAGGMQMEVRRTGPPIKHVRPARGPDIVYLRGEQRMQRAEEQARLDYAVRAPVAAEDSEITESLQKTVYKPIKRTRQSAGRAPASIAKSAPAKPTIKNASKKAPVKVGKKAASTRAVGPRAGSKAPAPRSNAVRATPKAPATPKAKAPAARGKAKLAASI